MSWHRDREDSATEADRGRASKRPQSAQSPLGTAPDLSLAPASNRALTGLLRSGRLPAPPSALAPAGNAAVARLMRTATVQRTELPAQDAGPLDPQIATAIDAERGGGAPLPDGIRTEMEGHLDVDLSPVRVHTGQRADTLNRAVNAQAFTSGTDVFFSAGAYNSTSSSGRELLAHELTHVARPEDATGGTGARVSHPDDAAEVEAREVARRVMRSAPGPEPAGESGGTDRVGPGGPLRSEAAGAARSPGEPLALQRSVGDQGGARMRDGRGKSAVVQRKHGPEPQAAKGLAATLSDEDSGHVADFMTVVGSYENAAYDATNQVPEPVGIGGPLRDVERRWLHTWKLVGQETPDATEQFSAHWDRLRPDLDAVGAWAAGHGFANELIAQYRSGVQRIEDVFLLRHSEHLIDSRLHLADVGNPEAAYEQAIAEQVAVAAKEVLAVVEKSESLLATVGTAAKTGGNVIKYGEAGREIARGSEAGVRATTAPPPGVGAATATLSIGAVKRILGTLAKAGSLKEKIDGLDKANDLKKAATAVSGVEFLVDSLHAATIFAGKAALAAGAKEGEKLLTLAGKIESEGLKQLDSAAKIFGVVTSILGIASSTLTLIDAIKSGNEQGIAHGSLDLAGSVASLGLSFAGGGAVPGVIVGGYVVMWKVMFDIMGELGAVLRQAELDAKKTRAIAMVGNAARAAGAGRRMITAWEEAQLRKANGPQSTEAAVAEVLEASADQEMTELDKQMNQVLKDLGGFRDDEDVDVKVRQDLAEHLGTIAINFSRGSGPHHPHEVTELCRTVFADVNAVVAAILEKAGLWHTSPKPW